jgi:hypothetical protein
VYGCEIWSLKLKEENLLRVFKNRVLRKIIGSKWDEVARQRRMLHKDELYDLYSSAKINRVIKSERMRWEGHVASMGDSIGVQPTEFPERPDGKTPVARARRRWENNIVICIQDVI